MKQGRGEVSAGFLLLLACFNFFDAQGLLPWALAACALHEMGHCLVIWGFSRTITRIRITVSGAELQIQPPLNYAQEAVAALAGPGVNFFLALFFSYCDAFLLFAGMHFVSGCFNMIPLSRLDGGRALFAVTALLISPPAAARVQVILDYVLTVLVIFMGILLLFSCGNPTLLLVALWQGNCVLSAKKEDVNYCLY